MTSQVGDNVTIQIEGNTLTIVVDLTQDLGLSASGKSRNIATTRGNIPLPGASGVSLGVNVYKRAR